MSPREQADIAPVMTGMVASPKYGQRRRIAVRGIYDFAKG